MTPPSLTVYADYVCPFCYLGEASLSRYLESAESPPVVDWHPFDLRAGTRGPDGAVDPDADDGKDDAYFERVGENVERLRERYGVEMTRTVARDVDSRAAQQLALAVQRDRDRETFLSLHHSLFDALWVDGRDLGEPAVLSDVAGDVGISAEAVRAALDDDDLTEALDVRFDAARRAGVTGVPTFVYDGYAARGAVPPEQLERLVEG